MEVIYFMIFKKCQQKHLAQKTQIKHNPFNLVYKRRKSKRILDYIIGSFDEKELKEKIDRVKEAADKINEIIKI